MPMTLTSQLFGQPPWRKLVFTYTFHTTGGAPSLQSRPTMLYDDSATALVDRRQLADRLQLEPSGSLRVGAASPA